MRRHFVEVTGYDEADLGMMGTDVVSCTVDVFKHQFIIAVRGMVHYTNRGG